MVHVHVNMKLLPVVRLVASFLSLRSLFSFFLLFSLFFFPRVKFTLRVNLGIFAAMLPFRDAFPYFISADFFVSIPVIIFCVFTLKETFSSNVIVPLQKKFSSNRTGVHVHVVSAFLQAEDSTLGAAGDKILEPCFSPSRLGDWEGTIRGHWVEKAKEVVPSYATGPAAPSFFEWRQNACYAETPMHSCFYQGNIQKAQVSASLFFESADCKLSIFNPSAFVDFLANRMLVFVGDSVTLQLFQAMLCNLQGFELERDLKWIWRNWAGDVNCPKNSTKCYLADHSCALFLGGGRVCYVQKMFSEPVSFASLPRLISQNDVVVFNAGLHFQNRNEDDFMRYIREFATSIQNQSNGARLLWRETSLQHFNTSTGSYDPSSTSCAIKGEIDLRSRLSSREFKNNKAANTYLSQIGAEILHTANYSFNLPETHVEDTTRPDFVAQKKKDCTHFCLPGMPDHWVRLIYNALLNKK